MEFILLIIALIFFLFVALFIGVMFRSEVLHVDTEGESNLRSVVLSLIVGIALLGLLAWAYNGFE